MRDVCVRADVVPPPPDFLCGTASEQGGAYERLALAEPLVEHDELVEGHGWGRGFLGVGEDAVHSAVVRGGGAYFSPRGLVSSRTSLPGTSCALLEGRRCGRRYRDVQALVVAELELRTARVCGVPRQTGGERAADEQRKCKETHGALFLPMARGTAPFADTLFAVLQQLDGRHHPRLAADVARQHGAACGAPCGRGGTGFRRGDLRQRRKCGLLRATGHRGTYLRMLLCTPLEMLAQLRLGQDVCRVANEAHILAQPADLFAVLQAVMWVNARVKAAASGGSDDGNDGSDGDSDGSDDVCESVALEWRITAGKKEARCEDACRE